MQQSAEKFMDVLQDRSLALLWTATDPWLCTSSACYIACFGKVPMPPVPPLNDAFHRPRKTNLAMALKNTHILGQIRPDVSI